jgi:adenosylcobinamide kinase/adenosylcobinamide-phosphate guanylyltransferase
MEAAMTLTFISGGARSGKSQFAERLAILHYEQELNENGPQVSLYYAATAQALDKEMDERVCRHRMERAVEWTTVETPYDIAALLKRCRPRDVVLLDCLTLWLNNMMYGDNPDRETIKDQLLSWMDLIEDADITLIIVSNDINEGIPSFNAVTEDYTKILQQLHQWLADRADQAIQVAAGIPIYWKE